MVEIFMNGRNKPLCGLIGFHPESPDGNSAVFILETSNFLQGQGNQGFARRRTSYVAQARPQIDAEIAKKGRFRMETR